MARGVGGEVRGRWFVCADAAGGAAAAMVSPERMGEHIEAIVGLLGDAPARARAGELGRRRAQQFTWERSTELLLSAFADLL